MEILHLCFVQSLFVLSFPLSLLLFSPLSLSLRVCALHSPRFTIVCLSSFLRPLLCLLAASSRRIRYCKRSGLLCSCYFIYYFVFFLSAYAFSCVKYEDIGIIKLRIIARCVSVFVCFVSGETARFGATTTANIWSLSLFSSFSRSRIAAGESRFKSSLSHYHFKWAAINAN